MTEVTKTAVEPLSYLYVERTTSMDSGEIGTAMGDAFRDVYAFMEKHGVAPAGPALALYTGYDPKRMTFRAGFAIDPADARVAAGDVAADQTPGGEALHFTHVGPYARLRESYDDAMADCDRKNLRYGMPSWELYVDDPETTPEDRLRTEVYMAIA